MTTDDVLFSLPAGISHEDAVQGMHEVPPRWSQTIEAKTPA